MLWLALPGLLDGRLLRCLYYFLLLCCLYWSRSSTGDMGELNPTGLFSTPLELVPLADPRKGMHPAGEAGLLLEPAPNAPEGYCPMLPWLFRLCASEGEKEEFIMLVKL
ncbi:uncharacterized protein [Triticum aestivum]|uniref:uncharacterized protein n=1 Tax=Triticum aestivum TaxID=4565 RepID=UPI001ABCFBE9|nr:uncharacterized protein LOC109769733 [Aegilops tauschii subsp. strangulata]XP_044375348.1 uncharacterized protein LOC123097623 [Triticum aestivum]